MVQYSACLRLTLTSNLLHLSETTGRSATPGFWGNVGFLLSFCPHVIVWERLYSLHKNKKPSETLPALCPATNRVSLKTQCTLSWMWCMFPWWRGGLALYLLRCCWGLPEFASCSLVCLSWRVSCSCFRVRMDFWAQKVRLAFTERDHPSFINSKELDFWDVLLLWQSNVILANL